MKELYEAVKLPQMEEPAAQEKPKRRGRPRYPDKPLLNALVLIPLGVASENGLAQKLAELPSLAEDCGFEGKTPSQPTLNRFKHRLGVEGFKMVFNVIADFKAELRMEIKITPANKHENNEFKPLVKAAGKLGLKASMDCGDAIHDTKATRRFVKSMGAKAFIDHNPRRDGGRKKPPSKTYRRLKASVERIFSRAKRLLYLENIRVRGLKSIAIHVYTIFIAMLAVAAAAHAKGLTKHVRCIRSVFGKT